MFTEQFGSTGVQLFVRHKSSRNKMPLINLLALTFSTTQLFQMSLGIQTEQVAHASIAQPAATTPLASEQKPAASASQGYATAEDLLDALEKADANLRSLTSEIQYDKIDGVTGDRQIRWGKVFFVDDSGGGEGLQQRDRKFAVRFDKLQLGDRLEEQEQLFVFNGEWLTEISPTHKQIIRRQVMPPGSDFDPLKVGEGPLPLPIGQKKADMLARFKVTLLTDIAELSGEDDEETAKLKEFVKGSYQLKLIPNPGTSEAEKFTQIRLWYRVWELKDGEKRLLPRMAKTVTPKSGNEAIVRMIKVQTNTPVDPKMMAADVAGDDWDIRVEALAQQDQTPGPSVKPAESKK